MSESKENPLELRMDEVLAEYMQKSDSGAIPDREEFLKNHPELREQLQDLLNTADWIEEMAGPTLADLAKSPSDETDGPHAIEKTSPGAVDETLPHFGSLMKDLNSETLGSDPSDNDSTPHTLPCQFGEYVLERIIGRGGMGVVYAGRQANLDRPVAIKMIRSGALATKEEVQRFYAEAKSAAKLDHPNIVTVYQCGEQDGQCFFSMDLVQGKDLSQLTAEGPLSCKQAARYVRDVAYAIQYAHDRGILHRDLKPANILIDEEDQVHITDFGLAKSIDCDQSLTATGAALGTPSYMAPEQAAGRTQEHKRETDIYSLGAILFTLVTGRPPFKAKSVVETIMHVVHRPAPSARSVNPEVDLDVDTIADLCLQKAADRRYNTAGDLANDLDRFLHNTPIQARPMSRLRRAWYWLLGVPIFGAVLDTRVIEPTDAHRWFQRGLISLSMLMIGAWLATLLPHSKPVEPMPQSVRIASGMSGGSYQTIASALANKLRQDCEASYIETLGSSENVGRLESGEVELALLQADAIGSSKVAVISPLYYEAVHILTRKDLAIQNLGQLKNRKVNVGSAKAGSHVIARTLLASVGIEMRDIEELKTDWHELRLKPDADAAIVVSKLGSTDVQELLQQGDYQLLSMSNNWEFSLDEPTFHPLLVTGDDYPECDLPENGVPTVATVAFLATQIDAPNILITTVLKHLFAPEMVATTGIVSAERAAHWPYLPWHPAARDYFQPYMNSTQAE